MTAKSNRNQQDKPAMTTPILDRSNFSNSNFEVWAQAVRAQMIKSLRKKNSP